MSLRYALEKLRFGMYVFFPIGVFYYFNRPEFYEEEILPNLRAQIITAGKHTPAHGRARNRATAPLQERVHPTEGVITSLPHTREGNLALIEELKRKRQAAAAESSSKAAE